MKHIKDILIERQSALFAHRAEKGSREWSAFNSVVGDRIEMFPAKSPREQKTPRYPNLVPIHRYHGVLKPSH